MVGTLDGGDRIGHSLTGGVPISNFPRAGIEIWVCMVMVRMKATQLDRDLTSSILVLEV